MTSPPTRRRQVYETSEVESLAADLGTEPTHCLLCQASNPRRLFQKSGKWFWRCHACDLVFVHDIYPEFLTEVEELSEVYHYDELLQASRRQVAKYRRILRHFESLTTGRRLLEVGCGQGVFLEFAQKSGWETRGVDVLTPVADLARQRGLEVFTGELFDAQLPEGSIDIAYMSEVIEHVVDPVPLLREVHRILTPGGTAILGTGNAMSWSARFRGRAWSYYRFGGHLHIRFYTPQAAGILADKAGFESVTSHTRGFAFMESREMKGLWYKPLLKAGQGLVSPMANRFGVGHRLSMEFHKAR